ncbi:MAG: alpha/beta hydrolase [Blastocatellia bacterium]
MILSINAAAQCPPLAVRNPEGNYIISGVKGGIVYRRVKGVELAMDAYAHPGVARRPGVLVIHGGNWDTGSRVAFVGQFLEMLTHAGYNWFSVDYRLGGRAKASEAVADLRAAVEFIRCHAGALRTDPDNLILLGEDAGASLAATLAAERPTGVKATVLLGGQYDPGANPKLKSMPATLVIHGTNDREAPPEQARAFCDAIRAGGGSCAFHPVDGASHRPENWWPNQWGYKQAVVSWLAEQTKWKGAAPAVMKTRLRKDLVFDAAHGLKLDAWVPRGQGPFPAVIIAHGGGWEAGDKVTYVTPLFEPLAKAGIAWFSIDYRLTPQVRHEEQLADFRRAIQYVRENAKQFRIDPNRIVILGESASGQMAAQLATERPEGVIGVVSFYGVYDFSAMVTEVTPRSIPARLFGAQALDESTRAAMRRYSPIENLRPGMPPMLLIHGTNERLHAQGVAMAKRLAAMGAPYEFLEVEGAPHGIENWEGHPQWMGYKKRLVEWLKATFAARQ